jgi:nitrate/nitrite transporter NarK
VQAGEATTVDVSVPPVSGIDPLERETIRRVAWRLLPLVMVALTFATMGQYATQPVFWAMPSYLLTGTAAAGGIAMINAVANLGSGLGPWVFGLVKDASGSDNMALLALAVSPIISIIALFVVGHDRRLERIPPRS